jgi:hypothetical protein
MIDAVDAARTAPATARWPRRVLAGLWLLAFLAAGAGLAARWDALMARLARLPVAAETGGFTR